MITFVGSTIPSPPSATGVEPVGVQAGDVLVAIVQNDDAGLSGPAGWAQVGTTIGPAGDFDSHANVWWIERGPSAPDLTWTGTASFPAVIILAYRGALPLPVASGQSTAGSAVAPTLTATEDGQRLVCLLTDSSFDATAVPPGMTSRTPGGAGGAGLAADETVTVGPSGTRTFTASDPVGAWAVLLAEAPAPYPKPTSTPALLRTLAGSHNLLVEARSVPAGQTGPDPDGVPLAILGGSVELDGTAKIRGSLDITVGEVPWPRHADDLVGPWGVREIFVRRGVDLGGAGPLWVPLGYFRPVSPEQDRPPDGPVRLECADRMRGLIKARLLAPRQFTAGTLLGEVVGDLVREVYPGAVIVWDDDTDQATLFRDLVCERDRYEFLAELADAIGKIFYWDRVGQLRWEAMPDGTPVWTVAQGPGGVLTKPTRRMTIEGAHNAVVAEGEAPTDDAEPVRGVAVDTGPNSPTRFDGDFGPVPRFFASQFLTTQQQAQQAAQAILRRELGIPYSVDLAAVPNPALDPWETVRVVLRDGTDERHQLERLSIPLSAAGEWTASTREQRLISIGVS